MAGPVMDPEVYGEPVFSELLINPEVYGEEPLADGSGTGSFTAKATLFATRSGSFTGNSVLKKEATGALTADSVVAPYLLANAILQRINTRVMYVDAVIRRPGGSFLAQATFVVPDPTPISIRFNGLDITDDVMIAGATFTQHCNGRPGSFSFQVKDVEHIYNFVAGGHITLDIHGLRSFDGYIHKATVKYAFPVDIVDADVPRIWHLEGPDLNILFSKRFVYDLDAPYKEIPLAPENSVDANVILDLLDGYIDLSGDNITHDGVVAVGSPNPDTEGYISNIGSTWGLAMTAIAQLPGAVWGLTPDRDLFYQDDDTEYAPFQLSDTPDNVTSFGYADFRWLEDGTKMVNDAQVWGAGTGSSQAEPVYARIKDTTSIANHGRWQIPNQFRYDMYRTATVTTAATSIVYGSVQNLHGAKDPFIAVTLRIKEPGLRAGHKVRVINSVFGVDKVLPIRRMTMTFPNKVDAIYTMELSQEIDEPWHWAEFAPYKLTPPKHYVPPKIRWPKPRVAECDCSITDAFDRELPLDTDGPGWGVSTAGKEWLPLFDSGAPYEGFTVSGGVASYDGSGDGYGQLITFDQDTTELDILFQFRVTDSGTTETFYIGLDIEFDWDYYNWIEINTTNTLTPHRIGVFRDGSSSTTYSASEVYDAGVVNWMRVHIDQDVLQAKVWAATDSEPGPWTVESAPGSPTAYPRPTIAEYPYAVPAFIVDPNYYGSLTDFLDIGHLDVSGYTRCTRRQFETFEGRMLENDMGVASPSGYTWHTEYLFDQPDFEVSPYVHLYIFDQPSTDFSWYVDENTGFPTPSPWRGEMDMVAKIRAIGLPPSESNTDNFMFTINGDEQFSLTFNTLVSGSSVVAFSLHTLDDGGVELGEVTTDDFTWEDEVWYLARWQFLADTYSRVKVWKASETEPDDWMIEGVPETDVDDGRFGLFVDAGFFPAHAIQLDWIDFDYSSKPCYLDEDCDQVLVSGAIVTPGDDGSSTGHIEDGNYVSAPFSMALGNTIVITMDEDIFPLQRFFVVSGSGEYFPNVGETGLGTYTYTNDVENSDDWRIEVYTVGQPFYHADITEPFGSFVVSGCSVLPIEGGSGPVTTTLGGYGCQNATRLTAFLYETYYAYIAGTTSIYIDNKLQRLGVEYLEATPSAGTLEFINPVAAESTVYVCYKAGGVPQGGGPQI